jgi:hypothetical protein
MVIYGPFIPEECFYAILICQVALLKFLLILSKSLLLRIGMLEVNDSHNECESQSDRLHLLIILNTMNA